jgi:hypothetical protein
MDKILDMEPIMEQTPKVVEENLMGNSSFDRKQHCKADAMPNLSRKFRAISRMLIYWLFIQIAIPPAIHIE